MHFLALMATEVETWKSVGIDVEAVMGRFVEGTNDPDYLEFHDCTKELKEKYEEGTVNCIKTPDGRFLEEEICQKYEIFEGKVYQRRWGQLHSRKRTKTAKKMQVVVGYPISKLYRSFEQFAEKSEEFVFHEEQGGYGYYYNPNGICDWYKVGGRWSQLFLVKDSCAEFSHGEFSSDVKKLEAPWGYQWVCAARKKEIAWEAARELLPEFKDRKYPVISYGFVRDSVWIPASEGQSLASWGKDVDEWISGLDDDAVLVGVDCHE